MFGTDGVGVGFISDLITAVGNIIQVVTEPPLAYFVIIGLVAVAAKLVRKFVRIKSK